MADFILLSSIGWTTFVPSAAEMAAAARLMIAVGVVLVKVGGLIIILI